jgi:hypothetical protein
MLGPELVGRLAKIVGRRRDPRGWMRGSVHAEPSRTSQEPFWFDYLSDAGDSGEAMYAVAVAALASFDGVLPSSIPFGKSVPLTLCTNGATGTLPRGQFLFVGGDTAYHVADKPTIRARVEEPFRWADEDLEVLDAIPPPSATAEKPRLYGIPGNHDWYDNLDGFRMAFQSGASESASNRGLGRFSKNQLASYVAIQLPHGWQFWGLDIDQAIDDAQTRYFEHFTRNGVPRKLVLCTPSPPIAFGTALPNEARSGALDKLDLAKRAKGSLRLDLAGDIHHYARYGTGESGYLAVVSGLGGVFHHPSFTEAGPRKVDAIYPTAGESLRAIGDRLLGYKALFVGSWIRVFPFLLTLALGYASTASGFVGWLTRFWFEPHAPPIESVGERLRGASLVLGFVIAIALLVIGAYVSFEKTFEEQSSNPSRKRNLWEALRSGNPLRAIDPLRSYWVCTWALVGAVAAPIALAAWPQHPNGAAWLDTLAFSIVLLGLVGGPIAAIKVGAKYTPQARWAFGVLGIVHGAIQVATPYLVAHLSSASIPSNDLWRSPVAAAGAILFGWLLLLLGRGPFARRQLFAIVVLAIVSVSGGLALLYLAAGGTCIHHDSLVVRLGRYVAGGVVAMLLCATNLTWYFAIAGLLNGHNNEVGGAARVSAFRQIIRFHVSSEALTGYVIRIKDRKEKTWRDKWSPVRDGNPEKSFDFALVDVFSLRVPSASSPTE